MRLPQPLLGAAESSPRSAQKSSQRDASSGSDSNSSSTPEASALCSDADAFSTPNHTGTSCSTSAIRWNE